jgi:uncharacterized membrane protein AbrB (regulator of aidB expression)
MRGGRVLFVLAALGWLFGPRLAKMLFGVDTIAVGPWILLIIGSTVLIGVLAYCLGKYTFAD